MNKLCWIKFDIEKFVDAIKLPTTLPDLKKSGFIKKNIFTLHFAVQITIKQEKRAIYCSMHYVHKSDL